MRLPPLSALALHCAILLSGLHAEPDSRIPIQFTLKQPGYVTLVIDNAEGIRVRNLISEQNFPAGAHTVYWDGLDDLERDPDAARHSTFHIPGKAVAPGEYTVRGLVHPGIDLRYLMTPYTNGNPAWRTSDNSSQWLTNHSAPSDVIYLPAGVAPEREGKPSSSGGQLLVCSRVAEGGSGLAWLDMDGHKLWGQHWLGGVWTAASHLALDLGEHPVDGVYAYAAASWKGDKYNQYKPELRLHKLVRPEDTGKAPRDKRFGFGEDRPVLEPNYHYTLDPDAPPEPDPEQTQEREMKAFYGQYAPELTGLAVFNGIIATAANNETILFINAHTSTVLGSVDMPDPRGLAFDRRGRLYILSGKTLRRYDIVPETLPHLPPATVVVQNLEDPKYVTISHNNTIYISDWGNRHQVKVFDAAGQLIGEIGHPGAPQIGRYDPEHLNRPSGTAIDEKGRLWITENFHTPKRVSIWDLKTGALVDAFYGPMRYGGSGAIDPEDKTRFFYDDDHGGTIEFKLDYTTGKSVPVALPYLKAYNKTGLTGRNVGAAPSYPIHAGGRLYLTDAYSLHTTGRRSAMIYRLDDDGTARIVAAAGNIIDSSSQPLPAFERLELQAKMPKDFVVKPYNNLLFVWSDLNGNQYPDVDEVEFFAPEKFQSPGSKSRGLGTVSVSDELSFGFSYMGDAITSLAPASIDENGIPKYNVNDLNVLAQGANKPASSGGNQILLADSDWVITTTPAKPFAREGLGGIHKGLPTWTYPSLWPGLHASHIAPMPENSGQLIGTTRVIGNVIDAPEGSEAGQLWAVNANKGTIYVFTVDGLFVTRLFQDSRTASWNAAEAIPGMLVNNLSLHEECFGPTWTRTTDGEVLLQGGSVGNIVRIENLNRIQRIPDKKLSITAEEIAHAQQWSIEQEIRRQSEEADHAAPLQARILTQAPNLDGKPEEWEDGDWVMIDKRKAKVGNWGKRDLEILGSLAFHQDTLYLIWKTYDDQLLRSSGESMNNLFKTGGGLDVMIGTNLDAPHDRRTATAGDKRLLVSKVKDRVVATLYEPIAHGSDSEPVEFGSPLRTIQFDRVRPVGDQVKLASHTAPDLELEKKGSIQVTYYELAVPLSLLDWKPETGQSYKFDIGLLRGDGTQTLQRVYWHNKAAGMVSDIPSEAELLPRLWGAVLIE
ncbi:hypothetical protein [Coraliomargarita parva]|uniref:hypothetical protein n=1 Tax=Coraliomargarita parva TaxID=3014050 RepID=UPI0022B2BD7E|nr:hypothetical protein [Coraliomargarita parva]